MIVAACASRSLNCEQPSQIESPHTTIQCDAFATVEQLHDRHLVALAKKWNIPMATPDLGRCEPSP